MRLRVSRDWLSFFSLLAGLWSLVFFTLVSLALLSIFLFQKQHPELVYGKTLHRAPMFLIDLLIISVPAWTGLVSAVLYFVYGCVSFRAPARGLGIATAVTDLAARLMFALKFGREMFHTAAARPASQAVVTAPFFGIALLSLILLISSLTAQKLPNKL